MLNTISPVRPSHATEDRWSGRLVRRLAILTVANLLADVVLIAPLLALPQMLQHFQTGQAAVINASAMLAGAMWAPLLGRSADIHGKRRILLLTLITAGVGSVICMTAPNLVVFVLGRFLQGAAVGSMLLTVALARQLCGARLAMPAVGVVTSGSSVLAILSLVPLGEAIDSFGYRSVFFGAAALAAVAAVSVRLFIPEPPIRNTGSIDVTGALLLGGGLVGTLGYVSLGPDAGWFNPGILAMLAAGGVALVAGLAHILRVKDPIIDLRNIGLPLALALAVVALAGGSTQSMLQLKSLVAQVSPDLGLGYGLGGGSAVLAMFALPALGIMTGGTLAGALAARFGPAQVLIGGIALGMAATLGMLAGVSMLPVALGCATLLGMAAGATIASGYNLATAIVPPEQHGTAGSLVTVMLAVGSVVLNVAGATVLQLTDTDIVVEGVAANSLTGVRLYILMAGSALAAAAVFALALVRRR
ncbi:MFS transporter [Streptomyces xinghaiensis]|uniref:MFS transporter n=1 Tax=Streptomyces xinghaiensis TaxID=1038928 RepID=UPI0002EBF173|nr:MFS transporter [Streptomyces xinghaiensis]MZE80618.1 MFS transporter [Streptomyces sp. SID5475]